MTKRFSAFFILLFLAVSLVMAVFVFPAAVKKTETPRFDGIWRGTWPPTFEKSLNENLPFETMAREGWGRLEFSLFGEGRKGVQVGADGWLFSDEEFSCLPQAQENMQKNLEYIAKAYETFRSRNIELVAVVIPSKARLYPEHLGRNVVPACRTDIYDHTVNAIASLGARTQGLLTLMAAAENKDALFLKTDTHWTPEGARLAAVALAETMAEYQFPKKEFQTTIGEDKPHEGDLLRYLPGIGPEKIARDSLKAYVTTATPSQADAATDLFGESVPPITLVGTSYSANSLWNFHGFLQEFLTADVLNMADEGLGPFAVMEKYLHSDALEKTPPAVVIWEIPERYMTVKQDFKAKSKD